MLLRNDSGASYELLPPVPEPGAALLLATLPIRAMLSRRRANDYSCVKLLIPAVSERADAALSGAARRPADPTVGIGRKVDGRMRRRSGSFEFSPAPASFIRRVTGARRNCSAASPFAVTAAVLEHPGQMCRQGS